MDSVYLSMAEYIVWLTDFVLLQLRIFIYNKLKCCVIPLEARYFHFQVNHNSETMLRSVGNADGFTQNESSDCLESSSMRVCDLSLISSARTLYACLGCYSLGSLLFSY